MAVAPPPAAARSHEHLVLDFLAYLEFERGLSRNTLEAYRSTCSSSGDSSSGAASGCSTPSTPTSPASSTTWPPAAGPPARGRGDAPAQGGLRAAFYRHLRREELMDRDPTADLRAPRKSQRLPHVLTRGEVARLLAAPRGTTPAALRDRALLELMYACGLRASEATGLDVADVDVRHGVLRARGKGSKERLVPVGAGVAAVRAYLDRGAPRSSACASSRGCSSTSAGGSSRARGSTRSWPGTPVRPGSRAR